MRVLSISNLFKRATLRNKLCNKLLLIDWLVGCHRRPQWTEMTCSFDRRPPHLLHQRSNNTEPKLEIQFERTRMDSQCIDADAKQSDADEIIIALLLRPKCDHPNDSSSSFFELGCLIIFDLQRMRTVLHRRADPSTRACPSS